MGYENIGEEFDVSINGEYLFTATVGKKGLVRLKQGLEITEILLDAIDMDVPIIATFR